MGDVLCQLLQVTLQASSVRFDRVQLVQVSCFHVLRDSSQGTLEAARWKTDGRLKLPAANSTSAVQQCVTF